jgi:hypothetical protein
MSIQPFDYDYWMDTTTASPCKYRRLKDRTTWREAGASWHWHCYSRSMTGKEHGSDAERSRHDTDLAPRELRDWLRKPAGSLRLAAFAPDDALGWLRREWEPVKGAFLPPDAGHDGLHAHLGRAMYDLKIGNDVCWATWTSTSAYLHLAIIGTADGCHRRPV